jgi:hypothetical protein
MVRKEGRLHIGLVDADLLDNGTPTSKPGNYEN